MLTLATQSASARTNRMFRPNRRRAAFVQSLERRVLLSATLLKDIQTTPIGSDPHGGAAIGGTLYFNANDAAHGSELWKTDGTAGGTQIVKDLTPGRAGSRPQALTELGDTLYFTA